MRFLLDFPDPFSPPTCLSAPRPSELRSDDVTKPFQEKRKLIDEGLKEKVHGLMSNINTQSFPSFLHDNPIPFEASSEKNIKF